MVLSEEGAGIPGLVSRPEDKPVLRTQSSAIKEGKINVND